MAFAVTLGVIGLVMIPAVAFSDTLRSASVRTEGASLRPLLVEAFAFYRSHWVQLVGVYLALFVPFIVVWAMVEKSALLVTGALAHKTGVVAELVLFQLCSMMRTGQSLLFTASVAASYRLPIQAIPRVRATEVSGDGTTVLP